MAGIVHDQKMSTMWTIILVDQLIDFIVQGRLGTLLNVLQRDHICLESESFFEESLELFDLSAASAVT